MLTIALALGLLVLSLNNEQVTYSCDQSAACGCSASPVVISRIFGGETAGDDTWDWVVLIVFNRTTYCGGTLISSSWILTAASCVTGYNAAEILVFAASRDISRPKQRRIGSTAIKHPNFSRGYDLNNIALIKVSPPFSMTNLSIAQICLPAATSGDYPPINSSLVAVGWGITQLTSGPSLLLQQASVRRIPFESSDCHSVINDESLQFCAGVETGTKGVCAGDTGGPLIMFTSSRQWVLVGVISYGSYCDGSTHSSVYARVTAYLDWIRTMNVTGVLTVNEVHTDSSSASRHQQFAPLAVTIILAIIFIPKI